MAIILTPVETKRLKILSYTQESWLLVKGTRYFSGYYFLKGWEMERLSRVISQFNGPLLILRLFVLMAWSHCTPTKQLIWFLLSPLPSLHVSSHWHCNRKRNKPLFVDSTHNVGELVRMDEERNKRRGRVAKWGNWGFQGRHWLSQGELSFLIVVKCGGGASRRIFNKKTLFYLYHFTNELFYIKILWNS